MPLSCSTLDDLKVKLATSARSRKLVPAVYALEVAVCFMDAGEPYWAGFAFAAAEHSMGLMEAVPALS